MSWQRFVTMNETMPRRPNRLNRSLEKERKNSYGYFSTIGNWTIFHSNSVHSIGFQRENWSLTLEILFLSTHYDEEKWWIQSPKTVFFIFIFIFQHGFETDLWATFVWNNFWIFDGSENLNEETRVNLRCRQSKEIFSREIVFEDHRSSKEMEYFQHEHVMVVLPLETKIETDFLKWNLKQIFYLIICWCW